MKGGWEEGEVESGGSWKEGLSVPRVRRNSVHTGTKYCPFWRLRPQFNAAPACSTEGCLELSDTGWPRADLKDCKTVRPEDQMVPSLFGTNRESLF